MQCFTYGCRKESPAYFDMASRFKGSGERWYGNGFRLGDRAAVYAYLSVWRGEWPNTRLTVIDDVHLPETCFGKTMPASWFCKDIADEVFMLDQRERIQAPKGQRLYYRSMWNLWPAISDRVYKYVKPPEIPPAPLKKISKIIPPGKYVTIQPLFDAAYNRHRNAPPKWWEAVCESMVREGLNVVVIGRAGIAQDFRAPKGALPLYEHRLNALESLAAISRANLHIGGETGLTLWSPIMQVSTIATYKDHAKHKGTRPYSFGSPIEFFQLGENAKRLGKSASQAFARSLNAGKVQAGAVHA